MKTKDVQKLVWDAIYASDYEKIKQILTAHHLPMTINANKETILDYALNNEDAHLLKIAFEFYPTYCLDIIFSNYGEKKYDNEKKQKILSLILNNNYFDVLTKIVEFNLNKHIMIMKEDLYEMVRLLFYESVKCMQLDKLLQFIIDFNATHSECKIIVSDILKPTTIKHYLKEFYYKLPDDKKPNFFRFIYSEKCYELLNVGLGKHLDGYAHIFFHVIFKFNDNNRLNLLAIKIYMNEKLHRDDFVYILNSQIESKYKFHHEVFKATDENGNQLLMKLIECKELNVSEKKEFIEFMLSYTEIDFNACDNKYNNLLIKIIRNKNFSSEHKYELISYLIKKEININKLNEEDDTPLNVAFYEREIDIVELLYSNDAYVTAKLVNPEFLKSLHQKFDKKLFWYFINSIIKKNFDSVIYDINKSISNRLEEKEYSIINLLEKNISIELYEVVEEKLSHKNKLKLLSKLLTNTLNECNYSLAENILNKYKSEELINTTLQMLNNNSDDIQKIEFLLRYYQQHFDIEKLDLKFLINIMNQTESNAFYYVINNDIIQEKLKDKNYLIDWLLYLIDNTQGFIYFDDDFYDDKQEQLYSYIKHLIDKGIIDNKDKDISTLLLFLYLNLNKPYDFVKQLELGFNPDILDSRNNTLLMKVLESKSLIHHKREVIVDIVKTLLYSGISINVINNSGKTLQDYLQKYLNFNYEETLDVLKTILDYVDIDNCVLDINHSICFSLINFRCSTEFNPNLKEKFNSLFDYICDKYKFDLNFVYEENTLLSNAIYWRNYDFLNYLINKGIDVNYHDKYNLQKLKNNKTNSIDILYNIYDNTLFYKLLESFKPQIRPPRKSELELKIQKYDTSELLNILKLLINAGWDLNIYNSITEELSKIFNLKYNEFVSTHPLFILFDFIDPNNHLNLYLNLSSYYPTADIIHTLLKSGFDIQPTINNCFIKLNDYKFELPIWKKYPLFNNENKFQPINDALVTSLNEDALQQLSVHFQYLTVIPNYERVVLELHNKNGQKEIIQSTAKELQFNDYSKIVIYAPHSLIALQSK